MKQNELVDVVLEDGTVGIARVLEDRGDNVKVSFLIPIRKNTYAFEDEIEDVPREAIQGFYDTDEMSETGIYRVIRDNTYERINEDTDTDEDFSVDDYDSEDDEDVSVVDSNASFSEEEDI
jgi:hypothetical protein